MIKDEYNWLKWYAVFSPEFVANECPSNCSRPCERVCPASAIWFNTIQNQISYNNSLVCRSCTFLLFTPDKFLFITIFHAIVSFILLSIGRSIDWSMLWLWKMYSSLSIWSYRYLFRYIKYWLMYVVAYIWSYWQCYTRCKFVCERSWSCLSIIWIKGCWCSRNTYYCEVCTYFPSLDFLLIWILNDWNTNCTTLEKIMPDINTSHIAWLSCMVA